MTADVRRFSYRITVAHGVVVSLRRDATGRLASRTSWVPHRPSTLDGHTLRALLDARSDATRRFKEAER